MNYPDKKARALNEAYKFEARELSRITDAIAAHTDATASQKADIAANEAELKDASHNIITVNGALRQAETNLTLLPQSAVWFRRVQDLQYKRDLYINRQHRLIAVLNAQALQLDSALRKAAQLADQHAKQRSVATAALATYQSYCAQLAHDTDAKRQAATLDMLQKQLNDAKAALGRVKYHEPVAKEPTREWKQGRQERRYVNPLAMDSYPKQITGRAERMTQSMPVSKSAKAATNKGCKHRSNAPRVTIYTLVDGKITATRKDK